MKAEQERLKKSTEEKGKAMESKRVTHGANGGCQGGSYGIDLKHFYTAQNPGVWLVKQHLGGG